MKHRQQRMYSTMPNLVLAFHGCDKSTYDNILVRHENMYISMNDYDWLGNGMYFWEQNLERAWQWAESAAKNPKSNINTPAVIGAIIDMGYCLNLLDSRSIELLKKQYEVFRLKLHLSGQEIPTNKNLKNDPNLLLRYLDCAVIQDLHAEREEHKLKAFDSVRGLFQEGEQIYPTSGFLEKTHIQICVRNPNCIKGFFAPREIDDDWDIV